MNKAKRQLTAQEKVCVIYGYVRRLAEEAKEQGLFKDCSLEEVIRLYLSTYLSETRFP